jgi:site-specific DNA recombinase
MWHGANRAARKGKWLGGIVPYGYRVNEDGYLEISEEPIPGKPDMTEAGVVRLIYSLTVDHEWSTIKIADYLNSLQIPPSYVRDGRKVKRGKRKENTAGIWRPSRIRNMIINPTYKGVHEYGKRSKKEREIIVREVPAIVSPEVWERAQQVLKENQIEAMRNARRQYLLRGLIKCGACGLTYTGTTFPGPKRQPKPYYVCNGKQSYKGPLQGKCRSKNIPAGWIEEVVWNECVEFILNPGEAIKALAETMEKRRNNTVELRSEIELIQRTLQDKETERYQILTLYRQKIITAADVEHQLQDIMRETHVLQGRIKELEQRIEQEEGLAKDFNTAEQLLISLRSKLDNPSFEDKREIVKTLVKEILVITEHPPEGTFGRPKTNVHVRYAFRSPELFSARLPLRLLGEPGR